MINYLTINNNVPTDTAFSNLRLNPVRVNMNIIITSKKLPVHMKREKEIR